MLMVGVTLALGSVVVAAAMASAGQADGSASLGSYVQERAAGVQLSLAYAVVPPSGSCPTYQGGGEGTALTVSLFDYGTVPFTPEELAVNSTAYAGDFQTAAPGALAQYTLSLSSCAHPSGLTIVAVDAQGDEVQLET